jgi:uncharacterized protein (TIGR02099 family)
VEIETILKEIPLPPQSRWRLAGRIAGWTLVAAYFVFAALVFALRYWILPGVGAHARDIEQSVSAMLGRRVAIGSIDAGWQGLRPELFLSDVTVFDRDGRPALSLPGVEATFAWTSLLVAAPRFHSLEFDRPKLDIRRDAGGKLYVAGAELKASRGGDGGGIGALALSHSVVAIRDGSIVWTDEQRGAPPLELSAVNLVLRDGGTHRFALRAKGPAGLASTLDVRGEIDGNSLEDLQNWSGQIYAELEYTDLVAWRQWVDVPAAIEAGKGGVRLWLAFADRNLSAITADVALSGVVTRLGKDLPVLDLDYVRGRIGGKQSERSEFEVFGEKIAFRTGAGIVLPPTDFRVRWQAADLHAPRRGEIVANALELAPLAKLADYLPLPQGVRGRLDATDPRGNVSNLRIAWTGDPDNPQHYGVQANFRGLAARAHDRIPGFAGLGGNLEATEEGGTLTLGSEKTTIELPGILPEGSAQLDALTGRIGWKVAPGHFELSFNDLSVANRDMAGILFGSFATKPGSPGVIDLTGKFSRADAVLAYRYIPWLPVSVQDYLKASILSGSSDDVQLRLKGDLAGFPFENPKAGTFQIAARLNDGRVRFAEGWPEVHDISGDLIFEGKGMRIAAREAGILDVGARSVNVSIPDLYHGEEHVQVSMRAEDETGDFLKFVAASPVKQLLNGATDNMRAEGRARLSLELDIPLRHLDQVKVAGSFGFIGGQLWVDTELPPLSRINGNIEFTDAGMKAHAVSAQFLGGPATISVATRTDGTIVTSAQGTAAAAQLSRTWGEPALRQISGSASWQATVSRAPRQPVTFIVQSQLTGIAMNLPAPFRKAAGEPLPLRLERVIGLAADGSRSGDTLKFTLGSIVSAQFERRRQGDQLVMQRGVVGLNEPAVLPETEGVVVTGSLAYLDIDRWRAVLGGDDGGSASSSLSVNVRVAALDFGGRRFNDVSIRAGSGGNVSGGNVWVANVSAKELAGEIAWRPEGNGRVVARLKQFTLPEASPGKKSAEQPARNLPALDIVADNLILRGTNLGKLEFVATNQDYDWRIENLVLTGPDGTLTARGVWKNWDLQPSVNINIDMKIEDAGKYLERMGYPRTMQSGKASLTGSLAWNGVPQSVDFASLTGALKLEASKGQFLKAEPGAARLLGILSMQSWVTLDFRELYGRGFAFDSINCSAKIANGVMSTQDFEMRGPSAQVKMSGEVDLAKETQNLHARVAPSVGDSVSLGAVLINPIWGLPLLLVQRILKDPLGQIFAFDYQVTGTWVEPKVERLKAEVRSADAAQPLPQ